MRAQNVSRNTTKMAAPLRVLLVEDIAIVALDLEDIFLSIAPVTVHTAASIDEAMRELELNQFDFAVLDLDVGGQTSLPLARGLVKRGLPFVFVSGYGASAAVGPDLKDIPILDKPLRRDLLEEEFHRVLVNRML